MRRWLALALNILFVSFLVANASAQEVQISGFTGIFLGPWDGSSDLSSEQSLCVYNLGSSDFGIRARGSGSGDAFTLSGTGGEVSYDVYFKSTGGYTTMHTNNFEQFAGAHRTLANCGGVANSMLKIVATAAALSGVQAGGYTGTLTVLLETR